LIAAKPDQVDDIFKQDSRKLTQIFGSAGAIFYMLKSPDSWLFNQFSLAFMGVSKQVLEIAEFWRLVPY
jgi:hypothetical protein